MAFCYRPGLQRRGQVPAPRRTAWRLSAVRVKEEEEEAKKAPPPVPAVKEEQAEKEHVRRH